MKLPICQYSKLFLLLTAFSFLDSLKAGRAEINSKQDILTSSPSSVSLLSLSQTTIESKSLQSDTLTTPDSIKYQDKQQQIYQQKQLQLHQHRVGVLMSSKVLNTMKMQQGFENFVDFFKVNLDNVSVDFIKDDGLTGFIKRLQSNDFETIVKTLNNEGINDYDENGTGSGEKHRISNAVSYCQLMEGLSRNFNKTVLLWPCPRIKESSSFLPSFEGIAFAVKSVAAKLNWTQVDIFVGDYHTLILPTKTKLTQIKKLINYNRKTLDSNHKTQTLYIEGSDDENCALSENLTYQPHTHHWSPISEVGFELSTELIQNKNDSSSKQSSPDRFENDGSYHHLQLNLEYSS